MIRSYDDEEKFFEDASSDFEENIDSWTSYFKAVDDYHEEYLEDAYGNYKISVKATKAEDISVKKVLEENDYWLHTLE